MSKEVIHGLILIGAVSLGFLIPKTDLAVYDLQITAGLFILFFLLKHRVKTQGRLLEAIFFTLIILLIINTTGETSSPFFFLMYFLLFSLALLLEPSISFVLSVVCVFFFLIFLQPPFDIRQFLSIFSLLFLAPFALFLGREYLEEQRLKKDTFLFLSTVLKNHIKAIQEAVENFMGDKELKEIEKSSKEMRRLIDKFEQD